MVLLIHDLEAAIELADRVLVLRKEKGVRPRLIDVPLLRAIEASAVSSRCAVGVWPSLGCIDRYDGCSLRRSPGRAR